MDTVIKLFGQGTELTIVQMLLRGLIVFFLAFFLIRISGRRSFGIRTPLDIIINILLGAVLSRGVVGASPFIAVGVTCFAIVIAHRLLELLLANHRMSSELLEGKKIELYANGTFMRNNMRKALVCEEDIFQGVRRVALTEDLSKIDKVYMERNGEISAIRKSDD